MAKPFTMLNKNSVPQRAIMVLQRTFISWVSFYFLGDKLFNYLAGSLSYTVLLIWLLISAAAFVLVRKQKKMGYTIFLRWGDPCTDFAVCRYFDH